MTTGDSVSSDFIPPLSMEADEADHTYLAPLFLGPAGENGSLMESLLIGFIRDHVYWRRNFHPEDPPSIPIASRARADFCETTGRLEQALFTLCADLKKSVPSFAPRYIGHMVSDPLLPALLGQLVTTLYNPNNIAREAAPVTLGLELEVGRQLARMLGMNPGATIGPCAWGHITSGGTVANYEALWLLRSARLLPPALAAALRTMRSKLPSSMSQVALINQCPLVELDAWALMNFTIEQALNVYDAVAEAAAGLESPVQTELSACIKRMRFEQLGPAFFGRHEVVPPVVLAPTTAHYSWSKAMTLLGLGRDNLLRVPTDNRMRMDCDALKETLDSLRLEKRPVLAIVGVLGTTEFGTVDPLDRIIALRERHSRTGMGFAIHVDAAWGGYLSSLFRQSNGDFRARREVRREFRYFPSKPVYQSFRAVADADTVTVDPHKLGYVTFGAGALVARDHRLTSLVGERAPYVYDRADPTNPTDRLEDLGDYILEGSKPGSVAAGVWLAHAVVPLDDRHFGRLCRQTIRANEFLYDRLLELAEKLLPVCRLIVPVEPDTNLICLAINPVGNQALKTANDFGRRVYRHFCVDATQPVQTRQFIGSQTSILRSSLSDASAVELSTTIGVGAETFVTHVTSPLQADHVFLIRHTLMSPWLRVVQDGQTYLDRYCRFLSSVIEAEIASESPRR